jgi:hypothetical protein
MLSILNLSRIALVSLALVGCADYFMKDPNYFQKEMIPISASGVVVEYDFRPSFKKQGIYYEFSRSMVQALEQWAARRLSPNGSNPGIVKVIIKEAQLTEKPNKDFPSKFEGTLTAVLSIPSKTGKITFCETQVRDFIKIENGVPSDDERHYLKGKLVQRLVDKFDNQMEKGLLQSLALSSGN